MSEMYIYGVATETTASAKEALPSGVRAWEVRLIEANERRMASFEFHTDESFTGEPTAQDVLENFLRDSASVSTPSGGVVSFADWATATGSDPDSKSAERTYNGHLRSVRRLSKFLGETELRSATQDVEAYVLNVLPTITFEGPRSKGRPKGSRGVASVNSAEAIEVVPATVTTV